MDTTKKGIVAVNLAAIMMGATPLFAKLIMLSPLPITFGRCVIAFFFLWGVIKLKKDPMRILSLRDAGVFLFLGALMAWHWVAYFYAIQTSTVTIGVLSMFTFPVITVLLEPLFSKEHIQKSDLLIAVFSFAGLALIMPEYSISNQITLSIVVGVLSGLALAIRNIVTRKYISHYSSGTIMFYQLGVVVLVLSPFVEWQNTSLQQMDWIYFLILGIFSTAIPHSLLTVGLKSLKAKTVGIISNLIPLYATILAALVLYEIPSIQTLLGGSIIVGSSVYESFSHSKK